MRVLIFILWLLIGVGYWYVAKYQCCSDSYPIEKSSTNDQPIEKDIITPINSSTNKKLSPIYFEYASDIPQFDAKWNAYKDSILTNLGKDQILQIKGFYFENEKDKTELGNSRANKVRALFELDDEKIRIIEAKKDGDFSEENKFNLISFRALINTEKIKEVDDKTIIYFPYNSTKKLNDKEVEAYLNDVADRVKKSDEIIRIIGHTDNTGDAISNMNLGQYRADVIQIFLESIGVPSEKIEAQTRGEGEPIATNGTPEGRASNRRAELQIIKK